ncbi:MULTISPECIES: hypothetical protein [unclassified Paenibacillus]|uniref:hypothetical protein n=1 Tax=unclassified Paenibacillus TaxID=185978 RepID=UPI00042314AB|nr:MULTISPECIES: hypothetical protein [unclassified Paenibacillus]KGP83955.1 hypothetical protein P364_0106495 [Paenibacillus sp. MAEPY2]KGP88899.1 hypothetical protein P363_0104160 [Paenibacillus sp. MAEPY1]
MLTKEDFKKLKKEAKHDIALIEQEVQHLQQKPDSTLHEKDKLGDDEEIGELIRKRQERKYSSWTIELCTIIENLLNQLYQQTHQKKFNSIQLMKTPAYRSLSNIEILQAELKNQHISPKSGMENIEEEITNVFQLRNKLIHSNFSYASIVRENHDAKQEFESILDTVKQYRKHLKYNQPEIGPIHDK